MLYLTKHNTMETYGGVEVWLHAFLTSALDGGEWSASLPGRFAPREGAPNARWVGGWVGTGGGMDALARGGIPASAWNRTPGHRSPDVVAIVTEFCAQISLLNARVMSFHSVSHGSHTQLTCFLSLFALSSRTSMSVPEISDLTNPMELSPS